MQPWSFGQVRLQRGSDSRPSAVQQHALIGFGQSQSVAHFGCRATLHIPQGDDLALGDRQRRNRALDDGLRFLSQDTLLGCERARRGRPSVGIAGTVGGDKVILVDRGLAICQAEQRRIPIFALITLWCDGLKVHIRGSDPGRGSQRSHTRARPSASIAGSRTRSRASAPRARGER